MILDDIVADKIPEVEKRKRELPVEELKKQIQEQSPPLDLASALKDNRIKIIAEVKKIPHIKGFEYWEFTGRKLSPLFRKALAY